MHRRRRALLSFGLGLLMLLSGCAAPSLPRPVQPYTLGGPAPTPSPTAPAAAPTFAEPPTPDLIIPTLTPYPDDDVFTIGQSVEGRPLQAWQFGQLEGPEVSIVLVGGIHGGYEANTIVLADLLIAHFRQNPDQVLPGVRLVIFPSLNPDGVERGFGLAGRFNANGVDLNRNWGCDWQPEAELGSTPVNPGPRPFSEPESVALRAYFVEEPPAAVLFYHSAAGGIFLGECGGQEQAAWLGSLLEASTGYPYYTSFDYYEVTGDATNWLAERGIPAAVIELYTNDDPEFERNLAGVLALQCALAPTWAHESVGYAAWCSG